MAAHEGTGHDRLSSIVGVRRMRNAPIIFADAGELHLQRGDVVVLQRLQTDAPSPLEGWGEGEESLATVIVGTGQIIGDAIGIEPSARVVRLASEAEIRNFDHVGVPLEAPGRVRAAGMPDGWDQWLQPAGAEPMVTIDRMNESVPTVGEFIQRLFPDPPSPRPIRGVGKGRESRGKVADQEH
jgi:hypothetical protein